MGIGRWMSETRGLGPTRASIICETVSQVCGLIFADRIVAANQVSSRRVVHALYSMAVQRHRRRRRRRRHQHHYRPLLSVYHVVSVSVTLSALFGSQGQREEYALPAS